MEQHAVPRQITTFEFKLIGFLTLKQFGYLAIFSALSVIFFYLVPFPLNIVSAAVCALSGVALVFVPYNDRPLDVWVKNFIKKLFSPSQYYFIKKNTLPDFLKGVIVLSTPQIIESHIDARQKLSSYLHATGPTTDQNLKKQHIHNLINSTAPLPVGSTTTPEEKIGEAPSEALQPVASLGPHPFLYGMVKNNKNTALPNVLVYIKDKAGKPQRILKTNQNGVFATFHSLPKDAYFFEIKDLGQRYFFDTMEYSVSEKNDQPINFISKERL